MATNTNIIEFVPSHGALTRLGSDTTIESGQRKPPETSTAASVFDVRDLVFSEAGNKVSQGLRLSQAELYPARHAFSREHITALRLLTLAIGRSKRALDSITGDNMLAADTEIQKLQVLLPELFCCRGLGDGFGTITNALMSAFEVLGGTTPDVNQIRAMNKVLQVLKEKPFLSVDEADDQVQVLESVGLNPYPAELVEFLSSE
jgi:hypothetical protein